MLFRRIVDNPILVAVAIVALVLFVAITVDLSFDYQQRRTAQNGADGAAALLGVNPSTLRNRMKKLGIDYGRNTARHASDSLL